MAPNKTVHLRVLQPRNEAKQLAGCLLIDMLAGLGLNELLQRPIRVRVVHVPLLDLRNMTLQRLNDAAVRDPALGLRPIDCVIGDEKSEGR
ncbi:hypothetical protein [Paenibacillus thiaminolyticus]|uniref:hypothetical protein n=1 Tax=Paenibacillus thiaminolyticus TaxID=49283 RepID=UPI002542B920|nr:hypothetical protein [Paenibacillus thiaminolyticus]WII39924.1 hypothetical protein O0V01_12900 [Paenibacillus thiaminolyticus]